MMAATYPEYGQRTGHFLSCCERITHAPFVPAKAATQGQALESLQVWAPASAGANERRILRKTNQGSRATSVCWRWRRCRHQLLVLRICPLDRGALVDPADIGDEFRPFRQELEHQAPAQRRADHDIGGGELLAHEIAPRRHALGGHVHRGLEIAVAQSSPPRLLLARIGAIGHGRLDAARAEEQPLEIDAAARIANRHTQARLGKGIGEIGADRSVFGDHHIAMAQRRDLAHRVDGEMIGRTVLALGEVHQMDVVRLAYLLEHPACDHRARGYGVIERELGHRGTPCWVPVANAFGLQSWQGRALPRPAHIKNAGCHKCGGCYAGSRIGLAATVARARGLRSRERTMSSTTTARPAANTSQPGRMSNASRSK